MVDISNIKSAEKIVCTKIAFARMGDDQIIRENC